MVRHGQLEPEQLQYASGKRLRLAQREMEHEPERQHQFDSRISIQGLVARRAALRCGPVRKRVFMQPEREVATSPQPGFVGRPVRDPVAGPRNAMTTASMMLEGHEGK